MRVRQVHTGASASASDWLERLVSENNSPLTALMATLNSTYSTLPLSRRAVRRWAARGTTWLAVPPTWRTTTVCWASSSFCRCRWSWSAMSASSCRCDDRPASWVTWRHAAADTRRAPSSANSVEFKRRNADRNANWPRCAWNNAVVLREFLLFILTVLFDVYSTTQFHRLLSQLTAASPIGCGSVMPTKFGLPHELLRQFRFIYVPLEPTTTYSSCWK